MLTVQGLSKQYRSRPVLQAINFRLDPGTITAMVGANGAGKSTLMKAILGLATVEQGLIAVGPGAAAPGSLEARRLIGSVPEQPLLYPDLTAWEHLRYTAMVYGLSEDSFAGRAERLLRQFDLWQDRHLDPLQMSKGMKQKVSLSAALLVSPSLLLLDEPFSGLDPLAARTLRTLLLEAKSAGTTVFMSTHMLAAAERLADRFLFLHQGRVLGDGGAEALRRQAGLAPDAPLDDVFVRLCGGDADLAPGPGDGRPASGSGEGSV